MDDLAEAHQVAKNVTQRMRSENRTRLNRRATDGIFQVGDTVLLRAEERLINTARWDPGYVVIRVKGTTHWLREADTGRIRKVHGEKLRLQDTTLDWDRLPPRPKRRPRKRQCDEEVALSHA